MQFTNPIFLWALAGLSIPIGIHLLSRKEGKVIRLGSLRHVRETSTQQFRGIRLNEILLLVLRCLLIVLFTFIISGLQWNNFGKQKWLLIERGLEKEIRLKQILDSLTDEGYEARFLNENFPLLEDSASVSSSVNYWSLMEKLRSQNLSDVIVFAQNRVDHFKGSRSVLPANVRWISQSLPAIDYTLRSVQTTRDSIFIREGHTNGEATYFTTKKGGKSIALTETQSLDSINITIAYDERYAYDLKIILAAFKAIRKSLPIELKVQEIRLSESMSVNTSDWLVWLSDKNIPEVTPKLFYIKPQSVNAPNLLVPTKTNQWKITQRLNEEVGLQENLTLKLASILIPREELLVKANSKDRRMVSDSSTWNIDQIANKNLTASIISEPGNPYLIVLLLVLLLVERTIAYKLNQ